jgi:hypothetical protein
MKHMKKIILIDIPAPVDHALAEHLKGDFEMTPLEKGAGGSGGHDPDLIIAAAGALPQGATGCPVLALSFAQPLRLGTLLRQIGQMLAQPVLYIDDVDLGGCLFKPQEKSLAREGREDIALTDREVGILAYLLRHRAAPVSREALLKNVWQYQEGIDTHTLETHIYRLRQKIEESADAPRLLLTVEGGYRLHLPETTL